MEALKNNGEGIKFIPKDLRSYFYRQAIKNCGYVTKYLYYIEYNYYNYYNYFFYKKNITDQATHYFEENNSVNLSIKYIKKELYTRQLEIEAVQNNELSLRFINCKTDQICLETFKNNHNAICYVNNKTDLICITAIKKRDSIHGIKSNRLMQIEYYAEQIIRDKFQRSYIFSNHKTTNILL